MNTKTIYATQKNLKPIKPNLLYEKLDKNIASNRLNFSNSGGLRKKNYYKSSIKDKPLISIITVSFNSAPPRGITYTLAVFRSGVILTSVTVTTLQFIEGILASFLMKISPIFCFTNSPTLNCL